MTFYAIHNVNTFFNIATNYNNKSPFKAKALAVSLPIPDIARVTTQILFIMDFVELSIWYFQVIWLMDFKYKK
jgi:hypothetical protein